MEEIDKALGSTVGALSDENYAQSLDFYRFWFDIGQTYYQFPSDQVFNAIWNNRAKGSMIEPGSGKIFHSAAHLILRFASDAESDNLLAPYSAGLQNRLCARSLREFFGNNLITARGGWTYEFYADANLIAHWANLGYVEEAAIRNHILQSLIIHPKLHSHQAFALIVLFKLAGATFEAYVDPSVVDRCFDLLKIHSSSYFGENDVRYQREPTRTIQVRAPCAPKGGHRTKPNFREQSKS